VGYYRFVMAQGYIDRNNKIDWSIIKKGHVFRDGNSYEAIASPKISSILTEAKSTINKQHFEDELNHKIKKGLDISNNFAG